MKKPGSTHPRLSVTFEENSALGNAPDAPEDDLVRIAQLESGGTVESAFEGQTSPLLTPNHYILRPATPPPTSTDDADLQRALQESINQESRDIRAQQDRDAAEAERIDRAREARKSQARTVTLPTQGEIDPLQANESSHDHAKPKKPLDAVKNSFLAKYDQKSQSR
jgi:hypothetical protein